MRPLLIASFCLLVFASESNAQSLSDLMHLPQSPSDAYRGLALGGGTTIVDGRPYFLVHAAPQFTLGPWGFGFDGNIRISPQGQLRKEDWTGWYSYLRWLNYVSFNHPHDDFYFRVGGLEHATIGNGTIVSDYWNNSSYDDRRIGAAARLDVGPFGAEGLTSDLFQRNLVALRPFVRPFQVVPILANIWFLSHIEIGVTGAFDFDTNATKLIPNHEPYVTHYDNADSTVDSVVIHRDSATIPSPLTTLGADISMMLWQTGKTEGHLYADYVRFQKFNDGVIIGARTAFNIADSVFLDLRAERSLFRNQFLPNYYNSFYERDRFDNQAAPQDYITKVTLLADSAGGNGNGFRAGAFLNYFNEFAFQGSYSHLDNLRGQDYMDLEVALPQLPLGMFLRLHYARKNINGVTDLFALDDRSLMYGELSYRPWNWLILTAIERWTFFVDDAGNLHTESIFEPRADVVISI